MLTVSLEAARALWFDRQGLTSPVKATLREVLERHGWMNSAGGAGPYLAFRARVPEAWAADIDDAVKPGAGVAEVPAVRGGTMLVAEEDVPLALGGALLAEGARFKKLAAACKLDEAALRSVGDEILTALGKQALSSEAIREKLPKSAVWKLGPEGERMGEPTSVSAALRWMMVRGEIRRMPDGSKLDRARYVFRATKGAPGVPEGEALARGLCRRFFDWTGLATAAELADWAGLTRAAAKKAIAESKLVPARITGYSDEAFASPEVEEALARNRNTPTGRAAFVPFRDNAVYFRESAASLLREPKKAPLGIGSGETVHHHAVLLDGVLAGLWAWDQETEKVVLAPIPPLSRTETAALEKAAAELEAFVKFELGHARFYAADGAPQQKKRLDELMPFAIAAVDTVKRARPKTAKS